MASEKLLTARDNLESKHGSWPDGSSVYFAKTAQRYILTVGLSIHGGTVWGKIWKEKVKINSGAK